jgi:hypothetical protein
MDLRGFMTMVASALFLVAPASAVQQLPAVEPAPDIEEAVPPTVETIAPPPSAPGKRGRLANPSEYKLILSDDKKTIHLIGTFASGLSGELKTMLKANPTVETILLSSQGGSMIDGFAVEKIIRQRGLNTHVELWCASACTEAFWGGKNRSLGRNARLGYHQATQGLFGIPFPLGDESQTPANQLWQRLYRERGFSEAFIAKAAATPNRDIWLPAHDELLTEKIVTRVVDKGGPGDTTNGKWADAATMERTLFSGKLWDFMRTSRPKIYYSSAHQAWVGWQFTKEPSDPAELAEKGAIAAILKNADRLPDALLLRFVEVEQALWAARSDVLNKSCRVSGFARPSFPVAPPQNDQQSELRREILLELARAFDGEVSVDKLRSEKAQESLLEFWVEMVVQGDYDSSNVARNFCTEPVNYYDILLKLPEPKRLEYFRALVATTLHPMPLPDALKKTGAN